MGQSDPGNLKVFLIVIFQNWDMLEKKNFQFLYVSKAATQKKMVQYMKRVKSNVIDIQFLWSCIKTEILLLLFGLNRALDVTSRAGCILHASEKAMDALSKPISPDVDISLKPSPFHQRRAKLQGARRPVDFVTAP